MNIIESVRKTIGTLHVTVDGGELKLRGKSPEQWFTMGVLLAACFQAGMPIDAANTWHEAGTNELVMHLPIHWLMVAAVCKV